MIITPVLQQPMWWIASRFPLSFSTPARSVHTHSARNAAENSFESQHHIHRKRRWRALLILDQSRWRRRPLGRTTGTGVSAEILEGAAKKNFDSRVRDQTRSPYHFDP